MRRLKLFAMIALSVLLIPSLGFSQNINAETVIKTLPAIANALTKGESKDKKTKEVKKIKHPRLIDKYKINDCVKYTCEKLGTFGCDSEGELERVKKMCFEVKDLGCIRFICDKLGAFGCDSIFSLEGIINSCRDVKEASCMKFACNQLGSFDCDSNYELAEVAFACKGADTSCLVKSCEARGSFACDSVGEIKFEADECKRKIKNN